MTKKLSLSFIGVGFVSIAIFAKPYDPTGWDELRIHALNNSQLSGYFSGFAENKMYQQRDYFSHSQISDLTVDVYKFWGDVIFDSETVPLYVDFLSNYNSKIDQLMYSTDQSREDDIFLDTQLYDTALAILDYHRGISNSSFEAFKNKVTIELNTLHGKTFKEARLHLFPDQGTCTYAQQLAGYC